MTALRSFDDLEQEHLELMKVVQEQIMDLGSSKSKKAKSSSQKLTSCQKWVNDCPSEEQDVDTGTGPDAIDLKSEDGPSNKPATQNIGSSRDEPLLNLISQLRVSRLPLPEPAIFSGDPLQYASWKQAYDVLMEHQSIPRQRPFLLLEEIPTWSTS